MTATYNRPNKSMPKLLGNFTVRSKKSLPGLGYHGRSTDKERANIQKGSHIFWFFDANLADSCFAIPPSK